MSLLLSIGTGQIDGQEVSAAAVHVQRNVPRPPMRRSPPRRGPPPRWRGSPPRYNRDRRRFEYMLYYYALVPLYDVYLTHSFVVLSSSMVNISKPIAIQDQFRIQRQIKPLYKFLKDKMKMFCLLSNQRYNMGLA